MTAAAEDGNTPGHAPAVLGVMLAVFLAALGQLLVVAAMPVVMAEFGEFDRYAWPTVSYLVASAAAMPVAGRCCDLFGCRRVIRWGLVVFLAGCLAVSFSQTMTQLIVLRVVEGLGAGVVLASCHVSAVDLYPPRRRGIFQGLIGVAYGVALLIGPVGGGAVAEHLGWPWVFRLILPVGAFVLIVVGRTYPVTASPGRSRIDVVGIALLLSAAVPVLLVLTTGGKAYAWLSWQTASMLGAGALMAGAFVWYESVTDAPIMPMAIYRDRTMAVAAAATALTGFVLYGSAFFLPLFLQGAMGMSATLSGAFVGMMMLAFVLGAVVAGAVLARTAARHRTLVLSSVACAATGMVLLAKTPSAAGPIGSAACAAIAGLGMGGTLSVLTVVVQNSLPAGVVGSATAALQFYRLLGGLTGLAALGMAVSGGFSRQFAATKPAGVPDALLQSHAADPAVLIDPLRQEASRQALLEHIPERTVREVFDAVQGALAGAADDALLLSSGVLVACFAVCLFLREPDLSAADRGPNPSNGQPRRGVAPRGDFKDIAGL